MGEPRPIGIILKEGATQGARIKSTIDAIRDPEHPRNKIESPRRELCRALFASSDKAQYGEPRFVQWSNLHFALGYLGLDSERVITNWEMSQALKKRNTPEGTAALNEVFVNNVLAIANLERQRPGSVGVLGNQFNIHNFYRYNPYENNLLIDQYDARKDRTKPFVLALVATYDYNQALKISGDRFAALKETLGDKYHLRIYEFDGRNGDDGIEQTLLRARSRYGPQWRDGQQAPLGILYSHGGKNLLRVAETIDHSVTKFDDVFLGTTDGETVDTQAIRGLFTDYATWVLGGCWSGVPEGIGEDIAKRFALRVIAPGNKSHMPDIAAIQGPHGIDFAVTYQEGVEAKVYDYNNVRQMIPVFPEEPTTNASLILPGDARFRV